MNLLIAANLYQIGRVKNLKLTGEWCFTLDKGSNYKNPAGIRKMCKTFINRELEFERLLKFGGYFNTVISTATPSNITYAVIKNIGFEHLLLTEDTAEFYALGGSNNFLDKVTRYATVYASLPDMVENPQKYYKVDKYTGFNHTADFEIEAGILVFKGWIPLIETGDWCERVVAWIHNQYRKTLIVVETAEEGNFNDRSLGKRVIYSPHDLAGYSLAAQCSCDKIAIGPTLDLLGSRAGSVKILYPKEVEDWYQRTMKNSMFNRYKWIKV